MARVPQHRRATRALAISLAVAAGTLAASVGSAGGQEGEPTTTTEPTGSTTTSTTAPPVTVVLEDGDFGVLPPGADDPDGPDEPPPDGNPLDPGDSDEIPPELPVVVLPDPTPGLNAALGDLADLEVQRAMAELAAAEEGRRTAQLAVATAYQARTEAVAARRAATDRLRAVRALIDELAVNAVMFGAFADVEPVLATPSLEQLRDIELMDVAVDTVFDALADAQRALRDAVVAEGDATRAVLEAEAVARWQQAGYLGLRRGVDEAIRTAAERRRQLGPPILGPSVLDTASLTSW